MNLLLLEPEELRDGVATVSGTRARHVREVLAAAPGRTLRVGVIGGRIGRGTLRHDGESGLVFDVELDEDPPRSLACEVVLALPRPKALGRCLQALAAFGVPRIVLCAAARVEKSYWQSPQLAPDAIRAELVRGLAQGRDTKLPRVETRKRFRPFVEDELAASDADARRLVAHPGPRTPAAADAGAPFVLAVGPEGGWVAFELALLERAGYERVSLGPRPLRVEHALLALLGRLA